MELPWTRGAMAVLDYVPKNERFPVQQHVEKFAKRNGHHEISPPLIFASKPEQSSLFPNAAGFAFTNHAGPVYALACSPFHRNLFLSCGADGQVRLYSLLQSQPVRTIEA